MAHANAQTRVARALGASAFRVAAVVVAVACVTSLSAVGAGQGDDVRFFEDKKLNFDQTSPSPRPPDSPVRTQRKEVTAGASTPPAPATASAGQSSSLMSLPPARSQWRELEIRRVRELTDQERAAMKSSLGCPDPLSAEVVLDPTQRGLVAQLLKMKAEQLPEVINWIVGRTESCFNRRTLALGSRKALEQLDEAVRRAAKKGGL